MYVLTNISFMDLAIVCFITAACIITMIGIIIFTSKASTKEETIEEEKPIDAKKKEVEEVAKIPKEKKEVTKEITPSSKRETLHEKRPVEKRGNSETKEAKTKIQDVLTQIEHELENGEREKSRSFEELQEEKAIISYQELLKVAGKLKEENESRGDVLEKSSIPKTTHEEAYNEEKRNRKKEELVRLALAKKAKMEKMKQLAALENKKVSPSTSEKSTVKGENRKTIMEQKPKREEPVKDEMERNARREEMIRLALERKAKMDRRNMPAIEKNERHENTHHSKAVIRDENRKIEDTYVPKKEEIPYLNFDKKLKREGNPDLMFERRLKKERMPNFSFEKEMQEEVSTFEEEKPKKEEKKFKSSDFISPIYGRMTNEEIRRSNDHFLDELKDLRKNLE